MPMRPHTAFGKDAAAALLLNRSLHNWANVGISVALLSLPFVMSFIPMLRNMALLVASLYIFVTGGLFCAYLLDVIPTTAAGEDELPDYGAFEDYKHSIVEPLVTGVWTVLALLVPWIAWRLALPHLDVGAANAEVISWLLGLSGLALVPIGFIATAWGGVGMVFRVDVLLRAVLRAPGAYTLLLVVLAAVLCLISVVLLTRIPERLLPEILVSLAGGNDRMYFFRPHYRVFEIPVLVEFVVVYTLVVMAKLLGLYQRHFGARLPWASESAHDE